MYRQKKIRDPIFSIYLNRDRQSNRGGNIMLGFVDQKHIHKTRYPNGSIIPDEIKYLQVTSDQYWEIAVDKIVIKPDHPPHNENVTLCPSGCKAIADSSSNAIEGPKDDIEKIHDMIDAQLINGNWTVNCDTVNKLPKIDFVLGGQYFRLAGPQYIIKISSPSLTICITAFIPMAENAEGIWVLGGAFLSQYYSIYSIEDKTIGFVRAA
ncbi:hypothetical protein JTB14_036210 [Gonioctena quinquepunctata]|nr:hypothetical protein JTB14_036210 [Gonioctena quinquepunctata]